MCASLEGTRETLHLRHLGNWEATILASSLSMPTECMNSVRQRSAYFRSKEKVWHVVCKAVVKTKYKINRKGRKRRKETNKGRQTKTAKLKHSPEPRTFLIRYSTFPATVYTEIALDVSTSFRDNSKLPTRRTKDSELRLCSGSIRSTGWQKGQTLCSPLQFSMYY